MALNLLPHHNPVADAHRTANRRQARVYGLRLWLFLFLFLACGVGSVLAQGRTAGGLPAPSGEASSASPAITRPAPRGAAPEVLPVARQSERIVPITYYHLTACPVCRDAEEYLAALSDRLSQAMRERGAVLGLESVNTLEEDGLRRFQTQCDAVGLSEPRRTVPALFVGRRAFVGVDEIADGLEAYLKTAPLEELSPDGTVGAADAAAPASTSSAALDKSLAGSAGSVGAAALVRRIATPLAIGFLNGLTPCSLSMLLFFLSLLMARETSLLWMGLLYCSGKFVTYLLLGTSLYGVMDRLAAPWLEDVLRWGMLAAVLAFAVLNLLDVRAAASQRYDRIHLQLPTGVRRWNHRLLGHLSRVTHPAFLLPLALVLGVATSFGEFLCTGQIYLASILMLVQGTDHAAGMGAWGYASLLMYNFAFILPPLLTTCVLHFGRGLRPVSEFFRRRMPWIKLANGVLFLVFGLVLLIRG